MTMLEDFMKQAGVPQGEAGALLASLLPSVVDHLTPDGQVPHATGLESTLGSLGSLLGMLGR